MNSQKRKALKVNVLNYDRKTRCLQARPYRASFNPEILQAGAVKGLIKLLFPTCIYAYRTVVQLVIEPPTPYSLHQTVHGGRSLERPQRG